MKEHFLRKHYKNRKVAPTGCGCMFNNIIFCILLFIGIGISLDGSDKNKKSITSKRSSVPADIKPLIVTQPPESELQKFDYSVYGQIGAGIGVISPFLLKGEDKVLPHKELFLANTILTQCTAPDADRKPTARLAQLLQILEVDRREGSGDGVSQTQKEIDRQKLIISEKPRRLRELSARIAYLREICRGFERKAFYFLRPDGSIREIDISDYMKMTDDVKKYTTINNY